MLRRLILPVLTAVLVVGTVVPAAAARRSGHAHRIARVSVQAEGHGSLIAVTFSGSLHPVRFLHSRAAIDRIALRDVDNDGEPDILAAPRDGHLLLWHNQGHGQFLLATVPPDANAVPIRGPRFVLFRAADGEWQCGDVRYDLAVPRAGPRAAVAPLSLVRAALVSVHSPVPVRHLSGRAPPSA